MIDIRDKKDCTGCNACVQRCPKSCIEMLEDEQGFLYPQVDLSRCIECDVCEKVCPVINQTEPRQPIAVYAAKNLDEKVRMSSSSGGVFFALAKKIIEEGGVVFGARFDERWEVVHDYAETLDGVKAFQGSKYVQSRIGDCFKRAEEFLKAGRRVMFTGTPCQLAGLRLYLRKDYGEQLLKVDVVCHGVPSPLVWRDYLSYITRPKGASDGKNTVSLSFKENMPAIADISFRDKRLGWQKFGFRLSSIARKGDQNSVSGSDTVKEFYEPMEINLYMQIFLKDLDLRPSCYACPVKKGKSQSDITLADYWGVRNVHPDFYDDKGVSLVLINSTSSRDDVKMMNDINLRETSYTLAVSGNSSIEKSVSEPMAYKGYWKAWSESGVDGGISIIESLRPPFAHRLIRRLLNLMPNSIKQTLKRILK